MDTKGSSLSVSDTAAERQGSTSKHGAIVQANQMSDHKFDGTANLTVGKATVLIPAPTADPRDPLNLNVSRKFLILGILIVYAVSGLCLVTALGALIGFFLDDYEKEGITQAQISGLLTYPSLFLGVGNIVSMPLAIAIGRRPVLLLSLLFLFISGILCATNQSFAWHLAARCVAAFSAAQCMALVLLIIQDIFFLHQRGRTFQLFSSFEVLLNSSLTIVSSYMSEALGWRSWYWLFTAISGVCFVLAFIFIPETDYARPLSAYMGTHAPDYANIDHEEPLARQDTTSNLGERAEPLTTLSERLLDTEHFEPRTWKSDMRIFVIKPDFTKAILTWKQMFEIWFFPHVLWVTLMNGFFQGTDVCIQITYGTALVSPPYNWANTQVSLIQIGQIIVAILCFPIIGMFSDSLIRRRARSNRGVHEPEQRLPPLIAPLLICIMMTIIFGFALQYPEKYHWFALAFTVNIWLFLLLAASTVGTTYLLDAHPARAGAIMVVIPVTRGLVSFGISYHTVDYINAIGAASTFGILSGIMGLFGLFGVVLYFKGKATRQVFSKWAN